MKKANCVYVYGIICIMKVDASKPLIVREIPVPAHCRFPNPPHPALPPHVFTMGIIAQKGSGKTTAIVNLIEFYSGYFHEIRVITPTLKNDPKWDYMKAQPNILSQNLKLKKWIEKQIDKRTTHYNPIVGKPPIPKELQDILDSFVVPEDFDGRIPESSFSEDTSESELDQMIDQQNKIVDIIKSMGGTMFLINRVLCVIDDSVGTEMMNRRHSGSLNAQTQRRVIGHLV